MGRSPARRAARERTLHVTLGTLFHHNTHVFEAVLAGLHDMPVNVIVTVGPGADPPRSGPSPRTCW